MPNEALSVSDRPVFIVSSPRSGSTLLQSLLNAHPAIAIAPEEDWLLALRPRYEHASWSNETTVDRFLRDLFARETFGRLWRLSESAARSAVLGVASKRSYATVSAALYRSFAATCGPSKVLWGSKEPYYVSKLPELVRLFPRVRIIHLVRDGRDVLVSMRERASKGATNFPTSVTMAALTWSRMVRLGHQHGTTLLGPKQYLEIKYKDLVAAPEGHLKIICEFLGLAYDPAMTEYYANAVQKKLIHSDDVDNYLKPVITSASVQRWIGVLRPDEVRHYEAIAGPMLRAFGYEVSNVSVPYRLRGIALASLYYLYLGIPDQGRSLLKQVLGHPSVKS